MLFYLLILLSTKNADSSHSKYSLQPQLESVQATHCHIDCFQDLELIYFLIIFLLPLSEYVPHFYFFLFSILWPHPTAYRILVPQPTSPAMEVWSLNHWTTREVPRVFLKADFRAGKLKQSAEVSCSDDTGLFPFTHLSNIYCVPTACTQASRP